MSSKATELRDIYLSVAEETTVTESQEQDRNRDPVDADEAAIEEEVSGYRRNHGLDDALEGIETVSA